MIIFKTMFLHLLHVLAVIGANANSDSNQVKCLERERNALLKFKAEATQDDNGALSSWKNETDCCQWKYIQCNNVSNRVIKLDLSQSPPLRFQRINPSLFELVDLNYLDLSNKNFNGSQIPESIGFLQKLSYLNLSSADLGGQIPHSIGNLSMLESLYISGNHLQGLIYEAHLFNLSKLQSLDLSSNSNLSVKISSSSNTSFQL